MLPQFLQETKPVQVAAPPRFRGVLPPVKWAVCKSGSWVPLPGITAAQKAGLRYEAKVHRYMEEHFGEAYRASPLIRFQDDNGVRQCIPDGLLQVRGRVVIFEVKHQHMPEAWWQLKRLYQPVVEALFPAVPVHVVEVCRSYDPSTPFPCSVHLIENIHTYVLQNKLEPFGVLKWKS